MENIFSKDDSANQNELEISEVCTSTENVKESPSQILESTIETHDDILRIKRESDSDNAHSDSDDNEGEDANINRAASALEDILSNTGEFKKLACERPLQKQENNSPRDFTSDILNSKLDAAEKNEKKKEAKSKREIEEEEREKMQVLVSNFTEDQLDRYEMYRRSAFPKASIKRTPRTEAEWKEIQRGFATRFNFPGCIGAIDCKHIRLHCPLNTNKDFLNDNGEFSVILLALVDSNYCFTYIDVGAPGGESNEVVFSQSQLKAEIEGDTLNVPMNAVIVGDDSFPLKTYLMKPYSSTGVYTSSQKIYNDQLTNTHRVAEIAFEILASKFRIFEKPIPLSIDKVEKVALASCALHNWLCKTSPNYCSPEMTDIEHLQTVNKLQESRCDVDVQGLCDVNIIGRNNRLKEAAQIRDKYCKYFLKTRSMIK